VLVVERPYADGRFRITAWAIVVTLVCAVGFALWRFAPGSSVLRVAWIVVSALALWSTWTGTRSARRLPNEWRFDDRGWSMSEPFGGGSARVEWSEVRAVTLTVTGHSKAILLETSEGSRGITIETVHADKVGVFVDQLLAHVPAEKIDPKVRALAGGMGGRQPADG
jgi:hypothetical protein